MFHAKCLGDWFLKSHFDCPICKAVFAEAPRKEEKEGSRNGSDGGPGIPIVMV